MFYKIIDKKVNAGFTVEAVFIIPFILAVIFIVLTALFYLHDEIIVITVLNKGVVNCETKENIEASLEKRLWMLQEIDVTENNNKLYRKVNIYTKGEAPLPLINMIVDRFLYIDKSRCVLNIRPEDMQKREKKSESEKEKDE